MALATEIDFRGKGLAGSLGFLGSFYAEGEYIRTDPATGVMRNRAGTRMCALTNDFLIGFRNAIVDECGPAADGVLKSCGRRWGKGFAKRFQKEMIQFYSQPVTDFSMGLFQACLSEAFAHHGWGRLQLDLSGYDRGVLVIHLRGAIYADLVKKSDKPIDSLTAGVFAGFFSELAGQDLDCLQTECPACGGQSSKFVVSLRSRIDQVESLLENRSSHEEIVTALLSTRG